MEGISAVCNLYCCLNMHLYLSVLITLVIEYSYTGYDALCQISVEIYKTHYDLLSVIHML